ncbi:sorting nexin-20 [Galendromus occidentalis]|uniref:Sorting nexin-20 n=1 Tax=Galendromus occidentalis TaxID=34638 RepID=A0AAJ7P9F0_9ACAR|nr:sorting nexin-20 [Galendromus occidentalis]
METRRSLSSPVSEESGIWSSKTRLSTSESNEPRALSPFDGLLRRCESEQNVLFEVVEARIVCDEKTKRYVLYTLAVKRPEHLGRNNSEVGEIERRYSDFLALYSTLRHEFPQLIASIPFPRKALMGNFTTEVIEARCHGFANFLSDAYVNREVRFSAVFSAFLFSKDARHGHELMTQGQFQDASCILLNAYRIAEKLYSLEDPVAFITVCLVIACLNACDNVKQAQKYAETAVAVRYHRDRADIAVPLLILSQRLYALEGKERSAIDKELRIFEDERIPIVNLPTLLAIVLRIDIGVYYPFPSPTANNSTP